MHSWNTVEIPVNNGFYALGISGCLWHRAPWCLWHPLCKDGVVCSACRVLSGPNQQELSPGRGLCLWSLPHSSLPWQCCCAPSNLLATICRGRDGGDPPLQLQDRAKACLWAGLHLPVEEQPLVPRLSACPLHNKALRVVRLLTWQSPGTLRASENTISDFSWSIFPVFSLSHLIADASLATFRETANAVKQTRFYVVLTLWIFICIRPWLWQQLFLSLPWARCIWLSPLTWVHTLFLAAAAGLPEQA